VFFMFRSNKFPVQVTGLFLTVHLLNAADARNVDQGFVSSETEYFAVSRLQIIAQRWTAEGVVWVRTMTIVIRARPLKAKL
jgi:hypothetical protein